jgi:two-component system LytT family sensor kinase
MNAAEKHKAMNSSKPSRLLSRTNLATIAAGWTLFGLFMAGQAYASQMSNGSPMSWSEALVIEMTYAYLWAALTPAVLWLSRLVRVEKKNLLKGLSVHIPAAFAAAFLHRFLFCVSMAAYRNLAGGVAFSWDTIFGQLVSFLDYGVLLYGMLLLIDSVFEYHKRYRENELKAVQLESELAAAQLQALKMQLHPHFLFNTLHAISALMTEDVKAARRMIARLSDLLRFTLENTGSQEVSLKEELEWLDRYLQIELIRFQDRLKVKIVAAPDTFDALVPNLILQPIVENAIRHGIAPHSSAGRIEIRASRTNGTLTLQVQDDGEGISPAASLRKGIGLANTEARMKQLYGTSQDFRLANAEAGGLIVTLELPFHQRTN